MLIVDDNNFSLFAFKNLLQHLKLDFNSCYSGKEAIDIILDKNKEGLTYDLIFMDLEMPIMNGYKVKQLNCNFLGIIESAKTD